MIKRFKNLLERYKLFRKIDKLSIKQSGVDSEGDPFVRLTDGTIFYGSKVYLKRDKYLYNFLKPSTKKVLSFYSVQVATDIVIRYVEGGLKYLGPKKQSIYTVKSGDHVAEMGAYQGFCAVKLGQQVGKNGLVVCIEPMEDNFRLLKKNIESNNLHNVFLVNKGVWDQKKTLQFSRRPDDGQSSSIEMSYKEEDSYDVEADTLDNILAELQVMTENFMIIQLNGAEINGLRGLTSFKPKNLSIAARYDTEGKDAALHIKQYLEERGYNVEIKEEDFVFATLQDL